jgi:HAMP domain-containing protein
VTQRGVVLLDVVVSLAAGAVVMVVQSAITERITALDLLTGAILAACVWLIRQQYVMGGEVRAIRERLEHTPTRKEVTDEIGETRHRVRNEVTELTMALDNRVTELERREP